MIFAIIAIILVIVLINKNSECKALSEENKKLKKELILMSKMLKQRQLEDKANNMQNSIQNENIYTKTNDTIMNSNMQNLNTVVNTNVSNNVVNKKVENIEKRNKEIKNQREQKNILILITGAVCIVLAAIVFLMSTWNVIPNILKTTVLSLLTLVFLGGSYIAKEKFKLEKTGLTFFYMAMAYIPICLISISIFELFGRYLSIYGEGRYIYGMLASGLVAALYYFIYKDKKSKVLLGGSILSQVLSIILFSLIFSSDILLIGINLLIYNILLMLFTKEDIFQKLYNLIPFIISFISLNMLGETSYTMIFLLTLLSINFLLLELKKSSNIYSYMFNGLLVVLGIYTIFTVEPMFSVNITNLLILGYLLLIYLVENMLLTKTSRKNLLNSLPVVIHISMGFLHLACFESTSIIDPYVVSIIQMLMLIATYIKSKTLGKNICAFLIPVYFIVTGFNIFAILSYSYHAYIIFAFITFIIGELFRNKDKLIHSNTFAISHILIPIMYSVIFFINIEEFSNDLFYMLLLLGLYIYSYISSKNEIFKYFSYISLNFFIASTINFFAINEEVFYYVPLISTSILMWLENSCKKLSGVGNDVYLAVSKITSFGFIYLAMSQNNSDISTIIALIFAVLIILDNFKNKTEIWNLLPLTCVIPAIFLNSLDLELKLGIMMLAVMITSFKSLKDRKISIFTIYSGIYLIFTSFNIDSEYLNQILFICWTGLHFLSMVKDKSKDLFKFLLYLSLLLLYNTVIIDLGIDEYTIFTMLGYIVVTILTLRKILIKYITNVDIFEYIAFACIYLSALGNYNDEFDGILFGALLVGILFVSYIKKYGALFMVTIFALLLNILLLTREFWFSVPWWAYLLLLGTTLIAFAIKNEVSDKKSEIKPINILKNIKEKIEK